jgi:hypothetical protein
VEQRYIQCKPRRSQVGWMTIEIASVESAQELMEENAKRIPGMLWRHVGPEEISNRVDASWSISLDLVCPYCHEQMDLLAEEWPERIQPGEHDTPQSKGYEVQCSSCDRHLLADFTY